MFEQYGVDLNPDNEDVLPEMVNIFGKNYVATAPMHEQRIDEDVLKGPLRKHRTARKRIATAIAGLTKAAEDTKKRVQRRAETLVRLEKGGTAKQRMMEQTVVARELEIFAGVERHDNRIRYTSSGTMIDLVGVLPAKKTKLESGVIPGTAEGVQNARRVAAVQDLHQLQAVDIPDHTRAVKMASSSPNLKREIDTRHYYNVDGEVMLVHCVSRDVRNADRCDISHRWLDLPEVEALKEKLAGSFPEPGEVTSLPRLSYSFRSNRAEVLDTLVHLQVLSDQSVTRELEEQEDELETVLAGLDGLALEEPTDVEEFPDLD